MELLPVELVIELSGLGEQLILGRMVGVNDKRTDDLSRDVQVVIIQISEQLFHRAAPTGTASE